MDPMLGMVFMVPWNWAPQNYQLCQGQTLALQQYEALYSLTGTVFGGNGSSNFMLPNLQGRTPIGVGMSPSGSYYSLAAVVGAEKVTLSTANMPAHIHGATFIAGGGGTSTPATATGAVSLAFSSATTLSATVTGAAKLATSATVTSTNTPVSGAVLAKPTSSTANIYGPATATADLPIGPAQSFTGNATGTVSGTATGNVTLSVTGGSTGGGGTVGILPTGGSTGLPIMQPSMAMAFVIAVNGLYPDRP